MRGHPLCKASFQDERYKALLNSASHDNGLVRVEVGGLSQKTLKFQRGHLEHNPMFSGQT